MCKSQEKKIQRAFQFSLLFQKVVCIFRTTTMIKPRMIMLKTKIGVDRSVKIPKSILGKYNVKARDVLTIQAMKGYIVLTPEKTKTSRNLQKKVNGHPKNIVQKKFGD